MSYSTSQLQAYATQQALQNGIPPNVLLAQINQESGWNPNAYNASGAEGLAQVLPSTAANPGCGVAPLANPYDPQAAISFAAQYDAALQKANGGNLNSALLKYSGGAYSADSLIATNTPANTAGSAPSSSVTATNNLPVMGNSVSGTATYGSHTTSLLNPVWEIVARGGLLLGGFLLVIVALIALLIQSKTVQVTAGSIGKAVAA